MPGRSAGREAASRCTGRRARPGRRWDHVRRAAGRTGRRPGHRRVGRGARRRAAAPVRQRCGHPQGPVLSVMLASPVAAIVAVLVLVLVVAVAPPRCRCGWALRPPAADGAGRGDLRMAGAPGPWRVRPHTCRRAKTTPRRSRTRSCRDTRSGIRTPTAVQPAGDRSGTCGGGQRSRRGARSVNPAARASSAVRNQTSARVRV